MRWGLEHAAIVVGAGICGVAIAVLLEPNDIVPGGVTGLSMIIADLLGVSVGAVLVALNLPLLITGWRFLGGRRLLLRTVIGIVVMAAAIDLAAVRLEVLTHDRLLVIFYGGLLSGVGLAAVHYGFEAAAVALMLSFVATRTLDAVLHGLVATRAALVVTERPDEVKETIRRHLHRSVTLLPAEGGFSGRPKTVLYVVVARAEVARLKRRVGEADPEAFATIISPQEVIGADLGAVRT